MELQANVNEKLKFCLGRLILDESEGQICPTANSLLQKATKLKFCALVASILSFEICYNVCDDVIISKMMSSFTTFLLFCENTGLLVLKN